MNSNVISKFSLIVVLALGIATNVEAAGYWAGLRAFVPGIPEAVQNTKVWQRVFTGYQIRYTNGTIVDVPPLTATQKALALAVIAAHGRLIYSSEFNPNINPDAMTFAKVKRTFDKKGWMEAAQQAPFALWNFIDNTVIGSYGEKSELKWDGSKFEPTPKRPGRGLLGSAWTYAAIGLSWVDKRMKNLETLDKGLRLASGELTVVMNK